MWYQAALKQKAGRITVAGITMGSDAEAELLPQGSIAIGLHLGFGGWVIELHRSSLCALPAD